MGGKGDVSYRICMDFDLEKLNVNSFCMGDKGDVFYKGCMDYNWNSPVYFRDYIFCRGCIDYNLNSSIFYFMLVNDLNCFLFYFAIFWIIWVNILLFNELVLLIF